MSGIDHPAMDAVYAGDQIEVETPTGKTFRARQNGNGLLVISTDSKLFAQTGEQALIRLDNALRAVGTEWSVHTEREKFDHSGREPEGWKDDLPEDTREFIEDVLEGNSQSRSTGTDQSENAGNRTEGDE